MKILLAEDDESISKITKMTLELIGKHQVTLVMDGEAALKSALENQYDLILLDGMMPKMNGLDVCKNICNKLDSAPPIIFLSAKSQDSDIKEALSMGARGYIQKPFDPSKISQQIDEILFATKKKVA